MPISPIFSAMTEKDLPVINHLEHLCFSAPWSEQTYLKELRANPRAFYWVLRPGDSTDMTLPSILAYGGYWLLGDEAHIMTIAAHPDLRRQGFGEWLLIKMLEQLRNLGVTTVTLEVRIGNSAAQKLYAKWGFREVGRRKRYYRDNGEDALLFTLDHLESDAAWRPFQERLAGGF